MVQAQIIILQLKLIQSLDDHSATFISAIDRKFIVKYNSVEKTEHIHPYISPVFKVKIKSNTPKIPFLSLDTLLEQFYKFCHPVFHQPLFLSSKKMKEVKYPTYIANSTWICNWS